MRWPILGAVLSVAIHVGLTAGVAALPKGMKHQATAISVAEAKKKPKHDDKPKADDRKPDPPKPLEAPVKRPAPAAPKNTPPPAAPPPVTASAPAAALSGLPDLGLSLSNGGGPGGMAIAAGQPGAGGREGPAKAAEAPRAAAPRPRDGDCAEDLVKPKPQGSVSPQYTDAARSANVEGRLRLSLSIDAAGNVTDVRVAQGLGYGLDEMAVSAARRMKFAPATRCGRAVESTATISIRYVLGD